VPAPDAEPGRSTVKLSKNQDRRLRSGHLWVFSNEIDGIEGSPAPGAEVLVVDHRGSPVGVGLYNPHSLIAVRLYARTPRAIDATLVRERLKRAMELRARIYPVEQTFRLIHGEGDYLPGLVVDRYGDYLAVQSLALGVDQRIEWILDVLAEELNPVAILCRRDAPARDREGLPLLPPIVRGEVPERVDAPYEGLVLSVDLLTGQKTGEFLDQRDNRKRLAHESRGRRMLDLYCYTGLFALHAAVAGAAFVLGIDRSGPAVERARRNLQRNAPTRAVEFREADVESAMTQLERDGERFDLIVLDPPALVKSRKDLPEGVRKYVTINEQALRLLTPDGMLATATCSHHVDAPLFLDIVRQAAKRAKTELRLVEVLGQSRDHPVLLAARETSYLTLAILERMR
jgi:23S rRNA (cytosine1962-C5)-methyltransferase